jgi:hypothetical protein
LAPLWAESQGWTSNLIRYVHSDAGLVPKIFLDLQGEVYHGPRRVNYPVVVHAFVDEPWILRQLASDTADSSGSLRLRTETQAFVGWQPDSVNVNLLVNGQGHCKLRVPIAVQSPGPGVQASIDIQLSNINPPTCTVSG